MPKLIIAFAGPIASGKSTLSEAVARLLGASQRSFGGLVRREASRRGLDHSRLTLQSLGAELHSSLGPAGMVEHVLADVDGLSVTVDGVRHLDVHHCLKAAAENYLLVFVAAPEEVLSHRRHGRSRPESKSSSLHETESQLEQLRAAADHLVSSDATTVDEAAAAVVALTRSSSA